MSKILIATDHRTKKGHTFSARDRGLLARNFEPHGVDLREIPVVSLFPRALAPKEKKALFQRDKTPTDEYFRGIVRLIERIESEKPNVVFVLGNAALWALTRTWSVNKHRGSILPSILPGVEKVVVSNHPSWYFAGMFHKLPLLSWDTARVVEQSKFPEHRPPTATFIINPNQTEIMNAVERFAESELLTIDTEWYSPEDLAYVGFSDSKDFAITIPANTRFRRDRIKEILENPTPKVMQNAMFDVVALARQGMRTNNLRHDTMVAFHSCWAELREKGLDTLASVLTEWPYYKADVEFVGTDDDLGQTYCCTDCVVTHESMEKILTEEFPASGGRRGYEISMKISDTFMRAAEVGIRVDRERLREMRRAKLEQAEEILSVIESATGKRLNVRSPQQVKELVYGDLGIKRTKQSTEQKHLMDIAASSTDEEVRTILTSIIRVRQNLNICSRYINEELIDSDGRLRCNWNLAGTRSGRLSSTQPWWPGIALQTMPSEAREFCIPDPGHTFLGFDYEQAEARVVALLTNDFDLLSHMESGKDIHAMMAPILNYTYEEIMAMVEEALAKGKSKDDVRERYLLKRTRHSMNYNQGWGGLKASINREYLDTGIGVTAAEAKELREGFIRLNPEIEAWWDSVARDANKERRMVNAHGRQRKILSYVKPNSHHHRELISFYPQSTVADTTTLAIAEIDKDPKILTLAHMHDGALFQVPLAYADEASEKIKRAAEIELIVNNHPLTIPVEMKRGDNWREL